MNRQEFWWGNRKLEILEALAPDEINRLEMHTAKLRKKRGEEIWFDEEGGAKVYVVDEGYVRICKVSDEGKRFILGILGPGEFIGAVTSDLNTSDSDEFLEVVRDTRIFALDAGIFHEVLKNHPEMSMRLATLLEEKQRQLKKRIADMMFLDTTARTADLLKDLIDRYGEEVQLDDAPVTGISLTHQEIADMVGAARPVVSGIISGFIKAGYLEKSGKFLCLMDVDGLDKVAEEGAKALSPSP